MSLKASCTKTVVTKRRNSIVRDAILKFNVIAPKPQIGVPPSSVKSEPARIEPKIVPKGERGSNPNPSEPKTRRGGEPCTSELKNLNLAEPKYQPTGGGGPDPSIIRPNTTPVIEKSKKPENPAPVKPTREENQLSPPNHENDGHPTTKRLKPTKPPPLENPLPPPTDRKASNLSPEPPPTQLPLKLKPKPNPTEAQEATKPRKPPPHPKPKINKTHALQKPRGPSSL